MVVVKDNIALVLRPSDMFEEVYCASCMSVAEEGFYVKANGTLSAADASDEQTAALIELCDKTKPAAIFSKFNNDRYKTIAAFRQKLDKEQRAYVSMSIGRTLLNIIGLADSLDIPIFLYQNRGVMLKKSVLKLVKINVVPIMTFSKTSEGMAYSLTLKTHEGQEMKPCDHSTSILSEAPGLLVMDNSIYSLSAEFSGKLLIPFLQKDSTLIPEKFKMQYFKKFILKNVSKCEVRADGFDLVERDSSKRCKLSLEKDMFGNVVLSVSFVYDDNTFSVNDKRSMAVRLQETDSGIVFFKWVRDYDWERRVLDTLTAIGMPQKQADKYVYVKWLSTYKSELEAAGLDIVQLTEETYYLGTSNTQQSTDWQNDWFRIHIDILLEDGRTIKFSDLLENILTGEREFKLDDGTVFVIPQEWFARYEGIFLFGTQTQDAFMLHKSQISAAEAITTIDNRSNSTGELGRITSPQRLKATLRDYQQIGFEWLYNSLVTVGGVCLSDDMGLGKTVQAIALMLKYKEEGQSGSQSSSSCDDSGQMSIKFDLEADIPSTLSSDKSPLGAFRTILIVSPASVLYNWHNELRKFAPSLLVCDYTGNGEERKRKRNVLMKWDVVLTTYQTMRNDIDSLDKFNFGIIIFDEAQSFKNNSSQLFHAVNRLQSSHKIALSGTPIENSLDELWSLMHVLNPILLGQYASFRRNYISPINKDVEGKKSAVLRSLIAPYFLRRTKAEVLSDLPERQDELILCDMNPEQKELYDSELSCARNQIMEITDKSAESINVLTAISRLRQIACHPSLVDKSYKKSGKIDEVFERLQMLHETSHKVLIFSEHVSLLNLVGEEMDRRGWRYETLTGSTRDRESVVLKFTENNKCHFFLVSLKAGGVGLNLTTADYVFLLDPWWNMAAEEQAIGRAHRIGQRNPVFVYRFVSKESLEEDILNIQERKSSLVEAVMPFFKDKR